MMPLRPSLLLIPPLLAVTSCVGVLASLVGPKFAAIQFETRAELPVGVARAVDLVLCRTW
jgi:hypothetical protein